MKCFIFLLLLKTSFSFAASINPKCENDFSRRSREEQIQTSPSGDKVPLRIVLIRHAPVIDIFKGSEKDYSINLDKLEEIEKQYRFEMGAPLSQKGFEMFREKCARMQNGCRFDLLIHSPTVRTWQTAQIFSDYFEVGEVRSQQFQSYENVFDEIKKAQAQSAVLVNHKTFLENFLRLAVRKKESISSSQNSLKPNEDYREINFGDIILLEFPSSFAFGTAEVRDFPLSY